MIHDGVIDIALGASAKAKVWKNTKTTWSELVERLFTEHKTRETHLDYMRASKDDQLRIKDVGGYVGGYLRNGSRRSGNVMFRQLLTLDIDFAHADTWTDFTLKFKNAAVLHSTHKHTPASPRYRLVMPLSRPVKTEEYNAIGRKVAAMLGIEAFDATTFDPSRLMFWQSNPKDVDYCFKTQDGEWLNVDEVLSSYSDWQNIVSWAAPKQEKDAIKEAVKKQQDPTLKRGAIGAFCKAYSIAEAIEEFLPAAYVSTSVNDRYTYTGGTTSGGLVVYNDLFAYSHHGTDPCSGKLCNAFDLVRIHKFGSLDPEGEAKKPAILESFKEMEIFVNSLEKVKLELAADTLANTHYDFAEEGIGTVPEIVPQEEIDLSWMTGLTANKQGKYTACANNINLILKHDYRLQGAFQHNSFDNRDYIVKSVPWRQIKKSQPLKNVDFAGIRNYIDALYGIASPNVIKDGLMLELERRSTHPVRDYLNSVKWDGVERINTLLTRLFGAADTLYTQEATRKMFVGAVARIFRPGVKFDLCLVLVSEQQGTGKSSFFKKIAKEWFSDSFTTVQGKEGMEQIFGAWIMEIAELSGVRKVEVESVKHYLTKQEDTFRKAYAEVVESYPRQNIFVGSTNKEAFLTDTSGNRRFLPITVNTGKVSENAALRDFLNSSETVDQLWAEAVNLYTNGEPLFMSQAAEQAAEEVQEQHREKDERLGVVATYLNTPLPKEWSNMALVDRRHFLHEPLSQKGTELREHVCALEVWCECFCKNREDFDRLKARDVNDMLRQLCDWEYSSTPKNFENYGKQRYYFRKQNEL